MLGHTMLTSWRYPFCTKGAAREGNTGVLGIVCISMAVYCIASRYHEMMGLMSDNTVYTNER